MSKAIVVPKPGGPSVMKWREVEIGDPGSGEVRIRHTALGLNFIDTLQRRGVFDMPYPFIPGQEAAGVIEAVGKGVGGFRIGERVAYVTTPVPAHGAYVETRIMAAKVLIKLPDDISDRQATAVMLKGMTARFLIRRVHRVRPGETILVHAAAGATGTILCQWAKHLGATVIGTVGTPQKAKLARAHGCDYTINYLRENFVARVNAITKGKGVPVVYDSVGIATFQGSLQCLEPQGLWAGFGSVSGRVPSIQVNQMAMLGSIYLNFGTLPDFTVTPAQIKRAAKELFALVRSGAVRLRIGQTYALKDAARAHRDLAGHKTTGSTLLIP